MCRQHLTSNFDSEVMVVVVVVVTMLVVVAMVAVVIVVAAIHSLNKVWSSGGQLCRFH